jgi:hypothetical protein
MTPDPLDNLQIYELAKDPVNVPPGHGKFIKLHYQLTNVGLRRVTIGLTVAFGHR